MSRPDIDREDLGWAGAGLLVGDMTAMVVGIWWWALFGMSTHVAVAAWSTFAAIAAVAVTLIGIGFA